MRLWVFYIIVLIINIIVILYQDREIRKLENKRHEDLEESIKEINKLRKED